MSRVPVVATAVVAVAVAAMVALGVWQLERRGEKAALLARYAANEHAPPIAMPPRYDDAVLFRRAVATCQPTGWSREAGRAADGGSGWRAIAACRGGFVAQMGVGADPLTSPGWRGGRVAGFLTRAPSHRALIAGLFTRASPELMIVADTPLPGLKANPAASLDDVPNNHLAYAVQWFLFAAIAAIIYAVALARRRAPVVSVRARG